MEHAVIVDVEPSTAVRQAEVTAAKTMIERTHDRFELWPERLIADTGYGSAEMLNWLVNDRGIEPHIPVFDKSKRTDDTFSREDFVYDHASDSYRCPAGKTPSALPPAIHCPADWRDEGQLAGLPRQQA